MAKRPDKNLIIGLDVGTSKVSALVGEGAPDNSIEVIGIGTEPSPGVEKCIQRCGLEVDDIVIEQLASSFACLTDDERELGVCIIDIGGGTTDLAVFSQGAIRHTAVIPIAGDQVTNDIAVSMRTPTQYAEDIKVRFACALSQLANPDESIEVPSVGDRPARRLARQTLAEVVEPRYEELFNLIREELERNGFEKVIAAGIVLTGGGARMEGAIELLEEIFHVPVRLGVPGQLRGLAPAVQNPIYSTAVGLLLYARENTAPAARGALLGNGMGGALGRIKSWFQGHF